MEEFYSEATKIWDLEKLCQDIADIKKSKLSSKEKVFLRGLLCGCSPKMIAAKIFWTSASLRTELSKGLYSYLTVLTKKEKITWHNIANDLQEMGYKNLGKLQSDLQRISLPINNQDETLSASEIIAILITSSTNSPILIHEEAAKAFEEGENLNKLKNYSKAIEYYYLGLKISKFFDVNILINIAGCYDRLKMYEQSLSICNSAIMFVTGSSEESFNRSRLYIIIGGIFSELAIKRRSRCNFDAALQYYKLADCKFTPFNSSSLAKHYESSNSIVETSYLLVIWNQIDLILHFIKLNLFDSIVEANQYEELAKKKVDNLIEVAQQGLEGGGYKRYRIQILDDMRSAFDSLDKYWENKLNEFENIKYK